MMVLRSLILTDLQRLFGAGGDDGRRYADGERFGRHSVVVGVTQRPRQSAEQQNHQVLRSNRQ